MGSDTMTTPLPLTGTALEIARRLDANQTVDHVTEVGRWKGSWQREDVLAVERWLWLQARHNEDVRRRSEGWAPSETPSRWDDCGTHGAAGRHRREMHELPCEPCRVADNAYKNERRKKTA